MLRFDLARHRIGVTLVCPGAVATPLVGTVDIVGVDRDDPRLRAQVARFERHAVSPEDAAESMLRGVERGRSMVVISPDVRLGWLAQRYAPLGYEVAMGLLNRRVQRLLD